MLVMSIMCFLLHWNDYFIEMGLMVYGLNKIFSIVLLLNLVNQNINNTRLKYLTTAVLSHCFGDFLIIYEHLFLHSILFFIIGHLFYAFSILYSQSKNKINYKRKWILAFGIVYSILFCIIIFMNLGDTWLLYVVLLYVTIIMNLFFVSIFYCYLDIVVFGCILYIISDSLIAINLFIKPPITPYLTWPCYYIGQIFIISGISKL